MRKLFISFAIFLTLALSATPAAYAVSVEYAAGGLSVDQSLDQSADPLDELIKQAELAATELAQHPQWLALLHYKDEVWTPRFVSQADDTAFFLAEQGKTDPLAELRADIDALLKPSAVGHAQCRFPARWHWLKQQLDIDDSYDVACPRLERWMRSIPSDSLTLVFPSMYLNNPGSSFGHTFIRFDNQKSVLLSQALNYAASYRSSDSLMKYVYNGLFGGYRGVFTMKQYFERVQEYSNLENRDIWEYKLDYTHDEIQQLIRHVWEVTEINFDYYFFNENCSYRLLALLDVLREDSTLTSKDKYPLYSIPVDTVRGLDDAGVITERNFRPSLATQLDTDLDEMDDDMREAVIQLADREIEIDAVEKKYVAFDQAIIFDNAYNLMQFRQQGSSEQAQVILRARSDIELPETERTDDGAGHAISPENGHASARFVIAAGQREEQGLASLQIRPAFHDLLDSSDGYIAGAKIDIGLLQIEKQEDESLQLDRLVFLNITSLPTVSDWQSPVSWMLDIRLQRQSAMYLTGMDPFISQQTKAGAGYSYDIDTSSAVNKFYALALLQLDIADELDKGYGVQSGVRTGFLHHDGYGQLKVQLQALRDVAGQESETDTLQLGYQYDLKTDLALRFIYERNLFELSDESEWSIGVNVYF